MISPMAFPEDSPSDLDMDKLIINASELSTPLTGSGRSSPSFNDTAIPDAVANGSQKKKKKKKGKKSAKNKETASKNAETEPEVRPPVLCISRNKHWRYISSYHGPWLQLPVELLDSLFAINLDPTTLTHSEARLPPLLPPTTSNASSRQREWSLHGYGLSDPSPPQSPRHAYTNALPPPSPLPPLRPGKAMPPPIDPGVFGSVRLIRKLIDEAAELSVRASSGLSAAELGSLRGNSGFAGGPWAAAQSLGFNPLGNSNNGGRNISMSPTRIHRLRALAVQKLAQAYKADEIASSVMVMQGGSVFDDVAERVLKTDPSDVDAKYVHFFHEKIPSRQLAESTSTKVLDELIAAHPQRLEYHRTRGIVHCFREEFPQATKDFTYALKEARAIRKARIMRHATNAQADSRSTKGKRRKANASGHGHGQAPASGTSAMDGHDLSESEPCLKHQSVLDSAPDPIEPQLLFLRGAAYLQQAVHLIETAVLELEGITKNSSVDGVELRLCYLEAGKYGGVEMGHPDGPLGKKDGLKRLAYTDTLGSSRFRSQITMLLKKSQRDHEKFISHFDSLDSPFAMPVGDLAYQTEYAFLLSESIRPGSHSNPPPPMPDAPPMFTTYHPLLVESHFSILICQLMLADFENLLPTFVRTACLVDGLEGYPIFLPPRSMSQAEFIEILERLASGWRNGTYPHSLSVQRGKTKLAIEASSPPPPSPFSSRTNSQSECDEDVIVGSSSFCSTDKTSEPSGSSSQVFPGREDADVALDYARILLAPVFKRQRQREEKVAQEKALALAKKKPAPINIPLHGPRVEVVLAWFGAVHIPELDPA